MFSREPMLCSFGNLTMAVLCPSCCSAQPLSQTIDGVPQTLLPDCEMTSSCCGEINLIVRARLLSHNSQSHQQLPITLHLHEIWLIPLNRGCH